MGYEKHILSREAKPISLSIFTTCPVCGARGRNDFCNYHNSEEDVVELKLRGMPWSLRNQKISLALTWDDSGNKHFDVDFYMKECLKYMIVEAPWGATTDTFLSTVDEDLGAALETLCPSAISQPAQGQDVDSLKKEPMQSSETSQM